MEINKGLAYFNLVVLNTDIDHYANSLMSVLDHFEEFSDCVSDLYYV